MALHCSPRRSQEHHCSLHVLREDVRYAIVTKHIPGVQSGQTKSMWHSDVLFFSPFSLFYAYLCQPDSICVFWLKLVPLFEASGELSRHPNKPVAEIPQALQKKEGMRQSSPH